MAEANFMTGLPWKVRDSSRTSTPVALFLSVFLFRQFAVPTCCLYLFRRILLQCDPLIQLLARMQGFLSIVSLLALIPQSSVHSS